MIEICAWSNEMYLWNLFDRAKHFEYKKSQTLEIHFQFENEEVKATFDMLNVSNPYRYLSLPIIPILVIYNCAELSKYLIYSLLY